MTTLSALVQHFQFQSVYTVIKTNRRSKRHIKVGITEHKRHGNWIIITPEKIYCKTDGTAGSSDHQFEYSSLSKDEVINKIDDFLFSYRTF